MALSANAGRAATDLTVRMTGPHSGQSAEVKASLNSALDTLSATIVDVTDISSHVVERFEVNVNSERTRAAASGRHIKRTLGERQRPLSGELDELELLESF